MYMDGKLLFCDHIFNGYGNARKDFKKQVMKTRLQAMQGFSLPKDFKFRYFVFEIVEEMMEICFGKHWKICNWSVIHNLKNVHMHFGLILFTVNILIFAVANFRALCQMNIFMFKKKQFCRYRFFHGFLPLYVYSNCWITSKWYSSMVWA